jgi:hypothetical protein
MALENDAIRNHHPLGCEPRVLCLRGGTGDVYRYSFVGQRFGSALVEPMSERADLIPRGIALDSIEDPGNGVDTESLPMQAGRISGFVNSEGADEITDADYGRIVFAVDDNTLARTNGDTGGGATRSPAGFFVGFEDVAGVETLMIELPDNFEAAIMLAQAIDTGDAAPAQDAIVHQVRGVVTSNVASLAAFTVAGNDGLTYSEGQLVLLVGQTTASQSGPYVVGEVAAGTAPLTRPSWWAAASVKPAGSEFKVNEGTAWAHTEWFATLAGAITVGTSSPAFYPRRQTVTTAAMAGTPGTVTTSTLWLRTGGKITFSRETVGGTAGHLSSGTATPGAGNGAVTITSTGNETSTITLCVHN